MKSAFIAGYFATWLAIPHLLLLKKRPSATLAWLWAILFIPYLGPLVYFAIGTDKLKRRRLRRRPSPADRLGMAVQRPLAEAEECMAALPRKARQLFQLLSRINHVTVSSAQSLRLLRDAAEFYPALEKAIREAQHHIHIEFYIFQGDVTGIRFLGWLTDAARRGVTVRMLLDEMGSHELDESLLAPFKAAGGRFSWFQSLDPMRNRFFFNLRNHRKLQVIDGALAFVGGMNIGVDYEGGNPDLGQWHDAQVEAVGAIACELQEVFATDWYFATGETIPEEGYYIEPGPIPGRIPVQVILGGPDRRNEPVAKTFVSLLGDAEERVWIATGYFVPDDILLTALEVAAARGVDVRLLISEKNDHPMLVKVGRSYYDQLLAAGVRIFEYSAGINHSKVAIADSAWAMVGSANLDYRSMRLNFELNLLVNAPEQNAALAGMLETDFAQSLEIERPVFARRPIRQKLLEAALRPLSPLL
jgi:cardiolipin synthase